MEFRREKTGQGQHQEQARSRGTGADKPIAAHRRENKSNANRERRGLDRQGKVASDSGSHSNRQP